MERELTCLNRGSGYDRAVMVSRALWVVFGLLVSGLACGQAGVEARTDRGSVVFLHPDGTGAQHWAAGRMYWKGPDGFLNWDRMPFMALYRGHMSDRLVGTSNGGATVHAFGVKVQGPGSYGQDGGGAAARRINSLSGFRGSVMREAGNAGHPIGTVNDGHVGEPGTGAFLAEVPDRGQWEAITLQMLRGRPGSSDVAPVVMLGAGEEDFLPEGVAGVHGPGRRKDGRNLVAEAQGMGYLVIRTRGEFDALMTRLEREPRLRPKVLGLFARSDTFNDENEEKLLADGMVMPGVDPWAKGGNLILWGGKPGTASFNPPTSAEMTRMALAILRRHSVAAGKGFFLVVEPESCDNLANAGNGIGMLHAVKRADDVVGVVQRHIRAHGRTMLLTAADSDANGPQVVGIGGTPGSGEWPLVGTTPGNVAAGGTSVEVPLDGMYGRGTRAFVSEPDAAGRRFYFGIAWAADDDVAGGILSRAEGLNAGLLQSRFSARFDSTDVYRMIYATLFGRLLR